MWLPLESVPDAQQDGHVHILQCEQSAYLSIVDLDDSIHSLFVIGKARNAPIKFTSIPRRELQAAVLATCLNKMLRVELDLPIQQTK